ncbi:MAG TPA: glycosyltransferase [Fimbriimonadaceae bacterium]|nr:glycosyltransferase [Fimbriimonadaceae bacterium]
MPKNPTVTVITATIGHPQLKRCIESVRDQRYARIEHLVVVDGPEWYDRADEVLAQADHDRLQVLRLPHATGKNTWNGHRIYGSMPFLVLSDYVCWLDDDNWFDEDHVESLIRTIMSGDAAWSFSLRKIVDEAGQLLMLDQCESLGNLHPTFIMPTDFLVDANCYMVRRDVAIAASWAWNRVMRPADGPGPDRLLCHVLMQRFPNAPATKRYTLNYTVANTPTSVGPSFFAAGNAAMKQRYPAGLPWET